MTRVILGGAELEGFRNEEPAASIRLLLPTDGSLAIPAWNGNEFLSSDGSRAIIRTFTPRRFDRDSLELHLDVVHHGSGIASTWAKTTQPGDEAAVSGPGRGYRIDRDAAAFLLAGDETAIPAICQLLEQLPDVPIAVHLAVRYEDARVDLHRDVDVTWHMTSERPTTEETLSMAIRTTELTPGMRIWAAGEAAEMQRIRKHLFNERGFRRSHATVRGYWQRKDPGRIVGSSPPSD
ncbi:MAG: siderophore-interacting protein [Acidimicrobiia bacterium]|nr:MAG: siderophore-interacting protein [Acidimicrobiia bacterium]